MTYDAHLILAIPPSMKLIPVPGPVEFFKFRNIGDNHFNLEWGSPMDENGEIIGYDMGYQTGIDLFLLYVHAAEE